MLLQAERYKRQHIASTFIPQQPSKICWWCLDTKIQSDHWQITVRTLRLSDLIWETNLICLQSEHRLKCWNHYRCTDPIPHNSFIRNRTLLLPSSIPYTCMQLTDFSSQQLLMASDLCNLVAYIHPLVLDWRSVLAMKQSSGIATSLNVISATSLDEKIWILALWLICIHLFFAL